MRPIRTFCISASLGGIFWCLLTLTPHEVRAADISCPTESVRVAETIGPNVANWQMCVTNTPNKGMTLSQITLTPPSKNGGVQMTLLESGSLGGLLTLGDTASSAQFILSATSGLTLSTLNIDQCPSSNGTLLLNSKVCMQRLPRGYAWRGSGLVQGESLVLFAVSVVGNDSFIHKWVFDEDGSIHPLLGVTGPLTSTEGRFVTAIWRLHFTLNNFPALANITNSVQQVDYDPCSTSTCSNVRNQNFYTFPKETSSTLSPDRQRFWRVVAPSLLNSNLIEKSLEISTLNTAQDVGRGAFPLNDLYVTEYKASCENFAVNECSSTNISSFLNNNEDIKDPVVWVTTTWHQTNSTKQVNWQGLDLRPRDLTTTSPLQ